MATSGMPQDDSTVPQQPQLPAPSPTPDQNMAVSAAQPQAPAAPAAAPQPPGSMWKQVLQGALAGLAGAKGATHFGGGLAGGAAGELQQKQQQFENAQTAASNTSINNFRDVQSAHIVAQTTAENAQIARMPQEYQDQRDETAAKMAELYQKNGWGTYQPVSLKDATGPTTYLNSQPGGASMPPHTITGATVAFVPSSGDTNSIANQYQTLAPAFGMAPMDRGAFMRLNPQQQTTALRQVTNLANGRKMDGSVYKPNELPQVISNTNDLLQKAKSSGAPDAAVQQLQLTLSDLQNQQKASTAQADTQAAKKLNNAKELKATPGAKAVGGSDANMHVATAPDGSMVAGTHDELAGLGAKSITKMPAAQQSQVIGARELTDPNAGLFHAVASDIKGLGPDQLGPVAGRWNEFMTGKVGDGPQFAKLRTDLSLLSTKIMQVHVGQRGSAGMLEHFKGLADAGKMDYPTLTNALKSEYDYVNGLAMRPKASYGGK